MFVEWLDNELHHRGWSDRQLALHAHISHSVISRARNGVLPRWEACAAIADALGLPAEIVFRRAGLLPQGETLGDESDELVSLLRRLPEKDRRELIQIARLKLSLSQETRHYPFRPAPPGSGPGLLPDTAHDRQP